MKIGAKAADGVVILGYEDLFELEELILPQPPCRFTIRIRERSQDYISFKVYFGESSRGDYYFQYNDQHYSMNGIYIKNQQEPDRIIDSTELVYPLRESSYLNIVIDYDGHSLKVAINDQAIEAELSERIDKLYLKIVPDWAHYTGHLNPLLVDKIEIQEIRSNGTINNLAGSDFQISPVFYDLPRNLNLDTNTIFFRLVTYGLFLFIAFLIDQVFLRIMSFRNNSSITSSTLLFLTFPTQGAILFIIRSCLALPHTSVFFSILTLGIVKFILIEKYGFKIDHKKALLITLLQYIFLLLFYKFFAQAKIAVFLMMPLIPWMIGICVHTKKILQRKSIYSQLFIFFIILILLTAFEITLRGNLWLNNHLDYTNISGELGWSLREHTNLFENMENQETKHIGHRIHTKLKPPGVYRILCLGSSSTDGVGSSDENQYSFPYQLERILKNKSSIRTEVMNAGIPGSSFYMLKVYLEEVLLKMDPDLLIVYFGGNDDTEGARSYYRRLQYEIEMAPFIQTNDQMWAALHLRWNPKWMIQGFLGLSRFRSFVAVVLMVDKIRNREIPGFGEFQKYEAWELTGQEDFFGEKDPQGDTHYPFSKTLEEIVKLCVDNKKKVVLVPEVRFNDVFEENPLPFYYDLFSQIAERNVGNGVYFKKILDEINSEVASNYFVDDVHLNDQGYLFLAERISQYLIDEGLFAPLPIFSDESS
ncbi:SGNH/GDSL hydrolase family protein [Thermodesulfobacteriota bacterium]